MDGENLLRTVSKSFETPKRRNYIVINLLLPRALFSVNSYILSWTLPL